MSREISLALCLIPAAERPSLLRIASFNVCVTDKKLTEPARSSPAPSAFRHRSVDRRSGGFMPWVREQASEVTCTWPRKCIPGAEAAYVYENLGPRYRHNPGHWLGGNHDRYGDVLNCHRGKHFGMPGKSTLSRRLNFKMVRASTVL